MSGPLSSTAGGSSSVPARPQMEPGETTRNGQENLLAQGREEGEVGRHGPVAEEAAVIGRAAERPQPHAPPWLQDSPASLQSLLAVAGVLWPQGPTFSYKLQKSGAIHQGQGGFLERLQLGTAPDFSVTL